MISFIKKLIKGNSLPCYIISEKPNILISYWQDFFENHGKILECFSEGKKVHFLFQLGWQVETPERVTDVSSKANQLKSDYPFLDMTFLCNSHDEESLLCGEGLNGVYCHQNAFLDPARYKVLTGVAKKYDAVYLARITPFKRHELASKVFSLMLIGDHHLREQAHFDKIMKILSHADWKRKVFSGNVYKYFSKARTGLCLSAEEGAMFVSAEYLLCGIPAVTTANIGGRNGLFDDEYTIHVGDTPEEVAEGVKKLIEKKIDPFLIREKTIEKMEVHRKKFISIIQDIYDRYGAGRDFSTEWEEVYFHKFGLRSSIPLKIQKKRILHSNKK